MGYYLGSYIFLQMEVVISRQRAEGAYIVGSLGVMDILYLPTNPIPLCME